MMYTPLNPYERYELTGMSDEEIAEERRQRFNDRYMSDDEFDNLIEEVFDNDTL